MNELVARNNCLGITHLKYNPYAHFKCLEKYKKIISTVNRISKEKEEILNKSIVKVHETTEIIDRLKEIILEAEPQVKQKR